jgi:mannose-6-phosphate isomerase-like protein (cupin superfamily)
MSDVRRVEKPWGHEIIWAEAPGYVGKLLHVKQGHALSLQYHKVKDETVYVQSGRLVLELEDDRGEMQTLRLGPGDARRILAGRRHRMTAETDVDVLEASTNHLDDVVRLEDRYGRAGTSAA